MRLCLFIQQSIYKEKPNMGSLNCSSHVCEMTYGYEKFKLQ